MNILFYSGRPEAHLDLVKKLQYSQKISQKLLKTVAKEIATFEVEKFQQANEKRYYMLHRHDGMDADFINTFLRGVSSAKETLFFTTIGDDTGKGSFILQGPEEIIKALAEPISKALDAKGNGKGTRFQGKVNNLKGVKECDRLIKKHFDTSNGC